MKKICTLLLSCFLIAGLCFPAFADILPPSYYEVRTDRPITRYRMEMDEDGSKRLVEAGKTRSDWSIDVIEVVTIDGKKYGAYQERDYENMEKYSPDLVRPPWVMYYFLMEDVFSPEEMATAKDKPHPWKKEWSEIESLKAQRKSSTEVSEPLPQTQLPETQSPQTAETFDEIAAVSDEAQIRSETQILPVCIAAAVILTLTTVVTLLLIRRKRNDRKPTTIKGEGE